MKPFNISRREYAKCENNIIEFQDNFTLFNVLQYRYPFKLYMGTSATCYSHIINDTGTINCIASKLFSHSQNNIISYESVIKSVDELVQHIGEPNINGLYLFSWGIKSIRYAYL